MTGFTSKSKMAQDRLDDDDIQVYAKPRLDQGPDYERGFVDGMLHQTQSSVDKAVNRMAQPAQEPVAWMVYTQDGKSVYVTDNPTDVKEGQRALPLYTKPQPRPWVGLTDEERDEILESYLTAGGRARAIEQALKEKNT